MESNEQKKSWDSLIEDLGAEPSPEAFERQQPPASEIPSQADSLDLELPQPKPSDWSGLASELGIEVQEPAPPIPPSETVTSAAEEGLEDETALLEQSAPELPVEDEQHAEVEVKDFEAKDSALEHVSDSELSDAESSTSPSQPSLFDDMKLESQDDPVAAESTAPEAESPVAETNEIEAEKEPEKKGLGGITGEAARSAFEALFSIGASAWGSAMRETPFSSEPRELSFSDDAKSSTEESDSDSESAEDEEIPRARRKRSRRRRGGRGRKSASENTEQANLSADEEGIADEQETEDSKKPRRRRSRRRSRSSRDSESLPVDSLGDGFEDENGELGSSGDEADDESSGESRKGRSFHRNLPTWSDAIGVIVDANLALHSKAPSKSSSSRGRGGRGRGGRGGRGRGGSKKS